MNILSLPAEDLMGILDFLPLRELEKIRLVRKDLIPFADVIFQRFARGLGLLNQNDPRPIHQRVVQHVEDLKKSFKNLPGNEIPNGIGKIISKETLSIDEINLLYKFRKCRDICVVWHELARNINDQLPAIDYSNLEDILRAEENFPAWFSSNQIALSRLIDLDLSFKQLRYIPSEIGNLTSLQFLLLQNNQLLSLPPELGNLHCLEILHLENNQLSSLPPEFGNLHSLETLILKKNNLFSLPPEFGNLHSLDCLHFDRKKITSLPPKLRHLGLKEYFNF